MKITELWKEAKKPTISFELMPPKSPKVAEHLENLLNDLPSLNPDLVSVTFGAGGSRREGSYELVKKLKETLGLEVIAYFAGVGLGPEDICKVLDSYRDLGIENILLIRGDAPTDDENYKPHPDSFAHASDIISFVRPKYGFCIGGAGYPEGHLEAQSREKDLEYLKLKVDNGAQFIISQYFYDNNYFFDFLEKCRAMGIDVPIIPGVMPIYSIKMMNILSGICGATVTEEVNKGLAALPEGDTKAVVEFGIEFALKQCRELIKAGVPGLHFYTMDRKASVQGIVTQLRKEGLL
jgi:methylenetetrahydrofolate reductase (NADPH)